MDSEGLMIGTPHGPRMVQLADDIQIFDAPGQSLSVEALTVSTHLAIFGTFIDGGQTLVAETLVVLPPPGDRPAKQQ
jgi:hypothetical protein